MSEGLAVACTGLAWLGGALLVLADARRGMALGLAIVAAGLALGAVTAGQDRTAAAVLLAGGLTSAGLHLGRTPGEWGLLRQGSTPRLMGSLIALIATGLIAGSAVGEPIGAARFGGLVVAVLAGARAMTVGESWAALGAGSALALALGTLGDSLTMAVAALVAPALAFANFVMGESPAR